MRKADIVVLPTRWGGKNFSTRHGVKRKDHTVQSFSQRTLLARVCVCVCVAAPATLRMGNTSLDRRIQNADVRVCARVIHTHTHTHTHIHIYTHTHTHTHTYIHTYREVKILGRKTTKQTQRRGRNIWYGWFN